MSDFITIDAISALLSGLDPSLRIQSIQVDYPEHGNLSVFFTDRNGTFIHRIIQLPEQKVIDRPLYSDDLLRHRGK